MKKILKRGKIEPTLILLGVLLVLLLIWLAKRWITGE